MGLSPIIDSHLRGATLYITIVMETLDQWQTTLLEKLFEAIGHVLWWHFEYYYRLMVLATIPERN